MNLETIFRNKVPPELSSELARFHSKASSAYVFQRWDEFTVNVGNFIEIARRIICYVAEGKYEPLDKGLPRLNTPELQRLESLVGGGIEVGMLRALYTMAYFRNKRGVHVSSISPNKADAEYQLEAIKWILCEMIRVYCSRDINEAEELIKLIQTRKPEVLWSSARGIDRVLNSELKAHEQVLVLLYIRTNITVDDLVTSIEYENRSRFRKSVLKKLHKKRLIEFNEYADDCEITNTGIAEAERIIKGAQ